MRSCTIQDPRQCVHDSRLTAGFTSQAVGRSAMPRRIRMDHGALAMDRGWCCQRQFSSRAESFGSEGRIMQTAHTSAETSSHSDGRGIRRIAIAAGILFVGVAVFQAAVALGAPLSDYVWGGFSDGQLSSIFRVASGFAAVSLVWMALVVLARGGVDVPVNPVPADKLKAVTWIIAGFMILNTLGNFASQSSNEQLLFAPVTALLAVLTGIVAARGMTPAD